jgi:hypothetical protein
MPGYGEHRESSFAIARGDESKEIAVSTGLGHAVPKADADPELHPGQHRLTTTAGLVYWTSAAPTLKGGRYVFESAGTYVSLPKAEVQSVDQKRTILGGGFKSGSVTEAPAQHPTVRLTNHSVEYCATCTRSAEGRIARSEEFRHRFMVLTGFPHGRKGYVIDHVVPLACGGADAPSNMQWQTIADAAVKDKTERAGCTNGRH